MIRSASTATPTHEQRPFTQSTIGECDWTNMVLCNRLQQTSCIHNEQEPCVMLYVTAAYHDNLQRTHHVRPPTHDRNLSQTERQFHTAQHDSIADRSSQSVKEAASLSSIARSMYQDVRQRPQNGRLHGDVWSMGRLKTWADVLSFEDSLQQSKMHLKS